MRILKTFMCVLLLRCMVLGLCAHSANKKDIFLFVRMQLLRPFRWESFLAKLGDSLVATLAFEHEQHFLFPNSRLVNGVKK